MEIEAGGQFPIVGFSRLHDVRRISFYNIKNKAGAEVLDYLTVYSATCASILYHNIL